MCGIVGAIDLRGRRTFSRERLAAMTAALAHRGPDGESFHLEPGLAMGVRRLALVDPDHGQQPMADASGHLRVAVNGELFAHEEERARLQVLGRSFRTRCDTEVWLQGWLHEGAAFLPRARGQFAVAIWDARERKLVLARDRFGICPLYTAESDGWLLWASEVKGLLASGWIHPALEVRAVDHVFTLLCASPNRSAFAGVSPVPAGHALEISESGTRSARFAAIEFPEGTRSRRAESRPTSALADELLAHLERAVRLRLRADAPVATYLSGGVDSSLLTALAARAQPDAITAFSVRLNGVGHDESERARRTAQRLGVSWVEVEVDAARLVALMPAVVQAAEGTVLDHADACLLALSHEVKARGFKAVLTGEGADEGFAGYPWARLHHGPWGSWLPRTLRRLLGAWVGGDGARLALDRHPLGQLAQANLFELTARARAFLYADDFWEALGGWTPLDDHPWGGADLARWHALNRSLWADYRLLLQGHLLLDKGDRVAMASGVEARFPFLDEAVVAFAASVPPSFKLRGLEDKWLLRRAAEPLVGAETARRRKHMFRASPVLHAPGRPAWVDQLVSPESLRRTRWFDPRAVHEALAARARGETSLRASLLEAGLTGVVTTQLAHHLFCGGGLCELPRWSPPAPRPTSGAEATSRCSTQNPGGADRCRGG